MSKEQVLGPKLRNLETSRNGLFALAPHWILKQFITVIGCSITVIGCAITVFRYSLGAPITAIRCARFPPLRLLSFASTRWAFFTLKYWFLQHKCPLRCFSNFLCHYGLIGVITLIGCVRVFCLSTIPRRFEFHSRLPLLAALLLGCRAFRLALETSSSAP